MQVATGYKHISVVSHQGLFVLFGLSGTKTSGVSYHVYSGGSWSAAKALGFPDLTPDPSVPTWLKQHPAFGKHLDFVYTGRAKAQALPIRAVSDGKSLFLFRVSPANKLWVDRFVYRRDTNEVEGAWQVRYQGTGQRYKSAGPGDPLTYYDSSKKPYLEPTTELEVTVEDGIYDVLRTPDASGGARWLIFASTGTTTIESTSIGTSTLHPFDPSDQTVTAAGTSVQQATVPGFAQHRFAAPSAPTGGIAAQMYYLRLTVKDSHKRNQQINDDGRIMVALATDPELAIVDVSLQSDGLIYMPGTFPSYESIAPGSAITFHSASGARSIAAYKLDQTDKRKAPFLLDSYDGFLHLLHVDDAGMARSAYYDISRRVWADANTSGSDRIKATTPWEGATKRVPNIPSVSTGARTNNAHVYCSVTGEVWFTGEYGVSNWIDFLSANAPLGSPRFARQACIDADEMDVWVVDEKGDLWAGVYADSGYLYQWSNLTPGSAASDPKEVEHFTPCWPLIVDVENRLWEPTSATSWREISLPKMASDAVTSIDAKGPFIYLTNSARELWWRDAHGSWIHIANGNDYTYTCARPQIFGGYPIIYAVWKGAAWAGQYRLFQGYTAWNRVGGDVFRVHYQTDGSYLGALDHEYRMWFYEPAPASQWGQIGLGAFAAGSVAIAALEYGDLTASSPPKGELRRAYFVLNAATAASHAELYMGELYEEEIGVNTVDSYIEGYIEGAIPVPSKNMTDANNPSKYTSFNSLELTRSAQTSTAWSTSEEVGVDALLEGSAAFFYAKMTVKDSYLTEASVAQSQSVQQQALLTMGGQFQSGEFRPDNMGVAMVNSCSATVYALRLGGSDGPIIAYRQELNPGSQALTPFPFKIDDRHVQNGELSSYQKPSLDFSEFIARNTAEREAYYEQFDSSFFKKHSQALPEITQVDFAAPGNWSQNTSTDPSVTFKGTTMSGAGGSFSLTGLSGSSVNVDSISYKALTGGHMSLAVKKTTTSTDTVTLGIVFKGNVLDPAAPNKVSKYSWITYFLRQELSYYDDLFANVVDLKWLASNDANAKAFRKLINHRRKVWRIAHVVTEVL